MHSAQWRVLGAVLVAVVMIGGGAWGTGLLNAAPMAGTQRPHLAPYVPTPQDVVERMLAMAKVGKNDVVVDLGSGDGRLVVTAARQFGARGIGIDIDPARKNILLEGLDDIASTLKHDAMIGGFEKKLSAERPWI